MILLFDAANTLIHKPTLFYKVQEVLKKFGYETTLLDLKFYHRIISEIIIFPDRTSAEFYKKFNKEWMYALGIIASDDMLDIIHSECSYLPWELFEDVNELKYLDVSKSILSNFHSGLNSIINNLMPNVFTQFIVSEVEKVRKPSLEFYERAINQIPISPSEIFYFGDSIKLDLEPALELGINAWVIDRTNQYPYCKRRITNLSQIKSII